MLTRENHWMRGYRIEFTRAGRYGYYWRPDDKLPWEPRRLFPSGEAAMADLRRHLDEALLSDRDEDTPTTI
jgi:hypothetical protein